MIELDEKKIEEFLESVAAQKQKEQAESPEQRHKLDQQFAEKLARLEKNQQLPEDVLHKLRVIWKLWRDSDPAIPWSKKALLMAALSYFVNPFDLVPDVAGKHGYRDDALVVRIVYRRLGDLVESATGDDR